MNYSTLLAVLTCSLHCSAMKIIPLQATNPVAEESVNYQVVGGIQSLARATKGQIEICIIGTVPHEQFTSTLLTAGDTQAKHWITPQLEGWSQRDTPIAFITFDSLQTCRDHCKRQKENRNDPLFYLPLQAEINVLGVLKEYKHNNLHILPEQDEPNPTDGLWDVTTPFTQELFPYLAEKAKLPKRSVDELDEHLTSLSPARLRAFWGKNGSFERFKEATLKPLGESKILSIEGYQELLKRHETKLEKLRTSCSNKLLKKELTKAMNHLRLTQTELISYLNSYGIYDTSSSLLEALCTAIQAEGTIRKTTLTFVHELLFCIINASTLKKYATIINTTKQYNHVALLFPYEDMHNLVGFLDAAGFSIEVRGRLPQLQQGNAYTLQASPFSQLEVIRFLQESFGGTSSLAIPAIPDTSPLKEILADTQDINSLQDMLTLFADENLPEPAGAPEYSSTFEEERCRYCQTLLAKEYVQDGPTCSYTCLVRHLFLKKAKSLNKLLVKDTHTEEEQTLLTRLGALCYLQSRLLSSRFVSQPQAFSVKNVAKLLSELQTHSHDQTWVRALSIAQRLQISLEELLVLLQAKQELLGAFLNKKRMASALQKQKKLKEAQEQLYEKLATSFSVEKQTPLWYARLYTSLTQTVGFNPEQLEQSLALAKRKPKKVPSIDRTYA